MGANSFLEQLTPMEKVTKLKVTVASPKGVPTHITKYCDFTVIKPGHVEQLVAHLTQEPEVPGSIPGPATYFRLSSP